MTSSPIDDVSVVLYLDDILIYSDNPNTFATLREVPPSSRKNRLYARAASAIPFNSCNYLSYMLSPDGLMMAENKIPASGLARTPEILGGPSFVPRGCQVLSAFPFTLSRDHVPPLTMLYLKRCPRGLSYDCRTSLRSSKMGMHHRPVLTPRIPDTPIM